jgi:hypothetical protein
MIRVNLISVALGRRDCPAAAGQSPLLSVCPEASGFMDRRYL